MIQHNRTHFMILHKYSGGLTSKMEFLQQHWSNSRWGKDLLYFVKAPSLCKHVFLSFELRKHKKIFRRQPVQSYSIACEYFTIDRYQCSFFFFSFYLIRNVFSSIHLVGNSLNLPRDAWWIYKKKIIFSHLPSSTYQEVSRQKKLKTHNCSHLVFRIVL